MLGGMKEINILPHEGSLICPPGKSMPFFYKCKTEKKIALVAKPDGFWTEDRPNFRSLAVTLGAESWAFPAAPELGTDWERLALAVA